MSGIKNKAVFQKQQVKIADTCLCENQYGLNKNSHYRAKESVSHVFIIS
jgi:hypothetical protein